MDDPKVPQPELPAEMTLEAMQAYVAKTVVARGFTDDLNEVFILMTEELGELAREFKQRRWNPQSSLQTDAPIGANLAFELADLILYLLDLANGFGVSLAALWPDHERALDARYGSDESPASVDPTQSLNALVAHVEVKRRERAFEDTPEQLMILLTEEVGEIANELRKHWKGKTTAERAGAELIDALTYVMRIAHECGVNLEQAVRDKEARNAGRSWDY